MITEKLATAITLIEEACDLLEFSGTGEYVLVENCERVRLSLFAQRNTLLNELHYAEKRAIARYQKQMKGESI